MLGATYAASLVGGTVAGMIIGDNLGAVATPAPVPATSSSAKPKATANGKPVTGDVTARQTVFLAAGYVVAALAVLLLGARVFKDARIG